MTKWDTRFMELAKQVSTWSKDPSTKIGAVIVGEGHRVLSTGYNGFPRGVEDSEARLNDRETKYKYVVHGELNAILNAAAFGVPLAGSSIYVYGLPVCHDCAKAIAQSGIKCVYIQADKIPDKWKDSWNISKDIFMEAGVTCYVNDMPEVIKFDNNGVFYGCTL